jgi:hypothetical protein
VKRIEELLENASKVPGNGVEDVNLRRSMLESALAMMDGAERKIRSIAASFPDAKQLLPMLFEWRRKVQEADVRNLSSLATLAGQLNARFIDLMKPVAAGFESAAKKVAQDAEQLRRGLGGLPDWFLVAAYAVGGILLVILLIYIASAVWKR